MAKKFSLEKFELLRNAGLHKKHPKDMLYMLTYMNKDVLNDIVRVVGYAISADLIYFNPSQDWIELA